MSLLGMHVYGLSSPCKVCGDRQFMHPVYDAEFCHTCNEWQVDTCTTYNNDGTIYSSCEFCFTRPDKPVNDEKNCISKENAEKGYSCEFCDTGISKNYTCVEDKVIKNGN